MTTGDEQAEGSVDNLAQEVDDQFDDLEREYSQAREELALGGADSQDTVTDVLQSSNERFELMSQVATLEAEVSRQADDLDERDRMLGELGDKVIGFEAELVKRDDALSELHTAKQEALDERREQARLSALLDARAAERQELAEVTNRLQNEREHVQELLTTALVRFDEAEAQMAQLDDKVRHLEAARDTAAHEHDLRAHELIESRAEMSKLADRLDELGSAATSADERAEKADALAERRGNEAGYLNRRIEALNDKLEAAGSFENDATALRRELTMAERRITELERDLDTQRSEATAANAAVDAIAERTSDYDELVVTIERLRFERDEAWKAASGHPAENAAPAEAETEPEAPAPSAEVASLAERARELSARRSNEAADAAQAAEEAAKQIAADAEAGLDAAVHHNVVPAQTEVAAVEEVAGVTEPDTEAGVDSDADLHDLEDDDLDVIEADLAGIDGGAADEPAAASEPETSVSVAAPDAHVAQDGNDPVMAEEPAPTTVVPDMPAIQFDGTEPAAGVVVPRVPESIPAAASVVTDTAEIPVVAVPPVVRPDPIPLTPPAVTPPVVAPPVVAPPGVAAPQIAPMPVAAAAGEIASNTPETDAPQIAVPATAAAPQLSDVRRRTILAADLVPNTPEAVAFLLNQPGVTAIVDARSTCGRTGIRPSELFDRVAALRDHFDVPVEVVVTPVSTPVGGAPDLPAIGVHHVTGADTVADRIRALCMGFPADQPLVVIAGDDHVRRAAIGEEANVVEPSAVLNLATD